MKHRDCPQHGKVGMLLYKAWCVKCDYYHQQWKYPCGCENGKIAIDPLGYKICDKCNGRGYLNEIT